MVRVLGLDIGDKRIGLAVSDELGLTSQGLKTIARTRLADDINAVAGVINELAVKKVVVGLPRNMNGSLGPQALKAQEFAACLLEALPFLEMVYWDERLTTAAAQRTLLEGDISRQKRKQLVDKIAAVLILQGYLDSCQINKK